jgi:hypothetical protein
VANGDALTKRYEVRDAETGELVEGAYVLVPGDGDEFARSCMFGYARLCGLSDALVRAIGHGELSKDLRDELPELMEPAPDSESFDGDAFRGYATIGVGDGSMEFAYNLMRGGGFEPDTVIMRAISDEERAAGEAWMDEYDERRNAAAFRLAQLSQRVPELLVAVDELLTRELVGRVKLRDGDHKEVRSAYPFGRVEKTRAASP